MTSTIPTHTTPFVDPRLDPEIEQIVGKLNILVPMVTSKVADALVWVKIEEACKKFWAAQKAITVAKSTVAANITPQINTLSRHPSPRKSAVKLSKELERDAALAWISMLNRTSYPHKAGDTKPGQSYNAWHAYLEHENPAEAAINQKIEELFDAWYDRFDESPERELRAEFLHRLRTHNQLGELLRDWEKMYDDKVPDYLKASDHTTRVEVLKIVDRIFTEVYFTPQKIHAPSKLLLLMTKNETTSTRASYHAKDGTIRLKVPAAFGNFGARRGWHEHGTVSDDWHHKPAVVLIRYLEERMHQFQDEMGKKYLAGKMKPGDPWIHFARPLLPQFIATPGQKIYVNGTYYLRNPVERHVEGFIRAVFKTLNEVNLAALEAEDLSNIAASKLSRLEKRILKIEMHAEKLCTHNHKSLTRTEHFPLVSTPSRKVEQFLAKMAPHMNKYKNSLNFTK